MKKFYKKMKGLAKSTQCFSIGKSTLGNDILCFFMGNKIGKQILLTGGIHAREYISTAFLLKEIGYLKNFKINGGIYFIPAINPDGINLVRNGIKSVKNKEIKKRLIRINNSRDFSLWKANINAVDLNVNYDANWGEGKKNIKYPNPENFIGDYPNSETENINIIKFLNTYKIDCALSYHSKGEVIYFSSKQEEILAKQISKDNFYNYEMSIGSTGGLSDYIRKYYNIPALTIEVGNDNLTHPIREKHLKVIFKQNSYTPMKVLEYLTNNG